MDQPGSLDSHLYAPIFPELAMKHWPYDVSVGSQVVEKVLVTIKPLGSTAQIRALPCQCSVAYGDAAPSQRRLLENKSSVMSA